MCFCRNVSNALSLCCEWHQWKDIDKVWCQGLCGLLVILSLVWLVEMGCRGTSISFFWALWLLTSERELRRDKLVPVNLFDLLHDSKKKKMLGIMILSSKMKEVGEGQYLLESFFKEKKVFENLHKIFTFIKYSLNLGWLRWENSYLQCRRPRFNPWGGKIPWRREWQPTPVFLPREFQGQRAWWATYNP